jgi:hypothetical protein
LLPIKCWDLNLAKRGLPPIPLGQCSGHTASSGVPRFHPNGDLQQVTARPVRKGPTMSTSLGKGLRALSIPFAVAVLFDAPAFAECRSPLNHPEWPAIARSIATLQLCEQIPIGPNQTASFKLASVEICSFPSGVSTLSARALLTCVSDSEDLIQLPQLDSEVLATVSLDTAACRILDSDIQINGEIGALLSGLENTRQTARDWAQSQLSRLCALQR